MSSSPTPEAQALIEEARRHQRRRHRQLAALIVLIVVVSGVGSSHQPGLLETRCPIELIEALRRAHRWSEVVLRLRWTSSGRNPVDMDLGQTYRSISAMVLFTRHPKCYRYSGWLGRATSSVPPPTPPPRCPMTFVTRFTRGLGSTEIIQFQRTIHRTFGFLRELELPPNSISTKLQLRPRWQSLPSLSSKDRRAPTWSSVDHCRWSCWNFGVPRSTGPGDFRRAGIFGCSTNGEPEPGRVVSSGCGAH